jgi:hypothetical protein
MQKTEPKAMKSIRTIVIIFLCLLIWLGYKIIPPEGFAVLKHYMFGDGSTLVLESDYIPRSPVIIDALEKMKIGQTKKISFKQEKDWQLSYAINGFDLTKTKNGFTIKQWIAFDRTGKVFTYIKTPLGKFKVYDNWVHLVECKPFIVIFNFKA